MAAQKVLPGTIIAYKDGEDASDVLDGLFSAGGLVLSQISTLADVEGYMIQNWIRRGFCSPPKGKKYSRNQFCRIITINLLKDALAIPEITGLISSINGRLDDESDDLIDDALLYVYFTRTLEKSEKRTVECAMRAAEEVTRYFKEPQPGFRQQLVNVLAVMFIAFNSSVLKRTAKEMALSFCSNAGKD